MKIIMFNYLKNIYIYPPLRQFFADFYPQAAVERQKPHIREAWELVRLRLRRCRLVLPNGRSGQTLVPLNSPIAIGGDGGGAGSVMGVPVFDQQLESVLLMEVPIS